jgi:hypothetical protein
MAEIFEVKVEKLMLKRGRENNHQDRKMAAWCYKSAINLKRKSA